MSIGNLKDSGNQGNNFPFQLKVLQGLQAVLDNNCCVDILAELSDINAKLRPFERTPDVISTTGSGTTPVGAYSVSIANVGASDATVNGQTIPAGTVLNFDGGVLNNTVAPLVYNANSSTLIITSLI